MAELLNQSTTNGFWDAQAAMDPEIHLHQGYRLYWIWSLKSVMMRDTVLENPFNSIHFFWVDVGCMRDSKYINRSLRFSPPQVTAKPDSIFIVLVEPFQQDELKLNYDGTSKYTGRNHLAGAIWGGSASSVLRFYESYFRVFFRLADAGLFVGKDQTVMNMACLETDGLCALVQPDVSVYNEWFFMLPFLLGDAPSIVPAIWHTFDTGAE